MRLWLIPMIYVAGSVVCGLALPRIEQAYLGSYTFNLSVTSAQACLSAAASGMMALTGRGIRHGLRHGAIQRDRLLPAAGALVCARSRAFSFARGVRSHVHIRPVHARMDRSGRIRDGAAAFHGDGGDPADLQHAALLPPGAAPDRPADHERASASRRQRPRGHSRHVPASRRAAGGRMASAESNPPKVLGSARFRRP